MDWNTSVVFKYIFSYQAHFFKQSFTRNIQIHKIHFKKINKWTHYSVILITDGSYFIVESMETFIFPGSTI